MKVSAYIPCLDHHAYLPAAIESIRSQTYPVEELLVIDDGSRDDSASLAAELGARVIRHETSLGRGAARARAFQEARHEFVFGLDATCTVPPNFLEKALPWFQRERFASFSCPVVGPPPANAIERWRARHVFQEWLARDVVHGALFTAASVLRRSAVLAEGNFDPTVQHSEDMEMGRRLHAAGWEVILDPNLTVLAHKVDTFRSVLERYTRWNTSGNERVSWPEYAKLVVYSIKVMARMDLSQRDPLAALISLICPHFQAWKNASAR